MGNNDLYQKYSIEKYCTRMEVAKAIKTNLIEPFWNEILKERQKTFRTLPIYDVSHVNFYLAYNEIVTFKFDSITTCLTKYAVGISQLKDGSIAKRTLAQDMFKISLKNIAKLNHLDATEITLQNILEHNPVNGDYSLLVNYYKAIIHLANYPLQEINEDFLATYYSILRGEEELTSFYRVVDNETSFSKALVDREYDQGIPARLIDDLMNNLFDYINNEIPTIANKIAAIMFIFNYVKPFEKYNLEMACLLAKRIIAEKDINENCVYIPNEIIFSDPTLFKEYASETQKTHDFTYFFIGATDLLIEAFNTALDRIVQVNIHALDVANKLGEDLKKAKEEFGDKIPDNLIEEVKPEKPTPKPVVEPKVTEVKIEEPEEEVVSDRELKNREIDMLESDPYIKKAQAHFYVRHCTKGKFYTIQQFKKAEGCVYETARTSMDNLATRGYYRREQIKNKFVYTPIDRV